jgi:hypothetical protein
LCWDLHIGKNLKGQGITCVFRSVKSVNSDRKNWGELLGKGSRENAKGSPRARSLQGRGGAPAKPALGTEAPIQSNLISRYVG